MWGIKILQKLNKSLNFSKTSSLSFTRLAHPPLPPKMLHSFYGSMLVSGFEYVVYELTA